MALLKKAASVIGQIVADPIGFLGNLISAIKLGIQQFVNNIWTHLKNAFMTWLFGSLAEAGIELPKDLSLPSILKLVLSVLGITYERMRAKAVKLLGPRAVAIIEKIVQYVKALIEGGPAKLWELVQEDLSTLKQMVIDALQDWIITTIVKRATVKLISLFNPAGAIIQAILLIYDTVTFLIENASRILAFVEAVIDSVAAIASGAIASAANWIEQALAKMLPLLIGFLAQLLGLGGISKKIKEFIANVQDKVDKAMDKGIAKVAGIVKKLFGGGMRDEGEQQKALDDALNASQAAVAKFAGKAVGNAVLKPILAAIRIRYRLASLEAVEQGDVWAIEATINPRKKQTTSAKTSKGSSVSLEKVASAQKASQAAAKNVDKEAKSGTNASFGAALDEFKKAELNIREAAGEGYVLPTRPGDSDVGAGFDTAFLTVIKNEDGSESYQLEIFEIKGKKKPGGTTPILASRRGSVGSRGRARIPVQSKARGAPIQKLMDKTIAARIASDEAVLTRGGRVLENKLSAVTENFEKNYDKMLSAIEAATDLPPEVLRAVQRIQTGKDGTLKIIVELRRGIKFSEEVTPAVKNLLESKVEQLQAAAGKDAANIEEAEVINKANWRAPCVLMWQD